MSEVNFSGISIGMRQRFTVGQPTESNGAFRSRKTNHGSAVVTVERFDQYGPDYVRDQLRPPVYIFRARIPSTLVL